MYIRVVLLTSVAWAFGCAPSCAQSEKSERVVLRVDAPASVRYGTIAPIVHRARSTLRDLLTIKFSVTQKDDNEGIKLTIVPSSNTPDSLVLRLFWALNKVGVHRARVATSSANPGHGFWLCSLPDEALEMIRKKKTFVLWFHANWCGAGVKVEKEVFETDDMFHTLARYNVPLVVINLSKPTAETKAFHQRISRNSALPEVFVYSSGLSSPVVLSYRFAKDQVITAVRRAVSATARGPEGKPN